MHKMTVLITLVSSEGSGMSAQNMDVDENSDQNLDLASLDTSA